MRRLLRTERSLSVVDRRENVENNCEDAERNHTLAQLPGKPKPR